MDYVIAMFEQRPYVVALVLTFLIVAPAERGFLRAGIWLVTGTLVGWAVEASSIRTGFPFGMYVYHNAEFADEMSFAGIPLFASLSFAALSYFGCSLAYTLLSPLKWNKFRIERFEDNALLTSGKLLIVAAFIITWIDLVIDPITHLGKYWWLGQIYHYEPEGMHFGVPLTNYLGWLFTAFVIVAINQHSDRILLNRKMQFKGAYSLPLLPLWGFFCHGGNYIFMLVVLIGLMNNSAVPIETPLTQIMGSLLFFSGIFFAFCIVMLRRGLRMGSNILVAANDSYCYTS